MLRRLEISDVDGMLEWMHEKDVNQYFRFDANKITEREAEDFIRNSMTKTNKHFAVCDEKGEYLGTISLKNINYEDENAEFAISIRKCARGNGTAGNAVYDLLRIAFLELKLQKIYLNVLSDNSRAINFYKKIGFRYIGESRNHVKIKGIFHNLKWFEIQKEDFESGNFKKNYIS